MIMRGFLHGWKPKVGIVTLLFTVVLEVDAFTASDSRQKIVSTNLANIFALISLWLICHKFFNGCRRQLGTITLYFAVLFLPGFVGEIYRASVYPMTFSGAVILSLIISRLLFSQPQRSKPTTPPQRATISATSSDRSPTESGHSRQI
ncbi:hypothetical protein [Schlesneria sp. T3-172]|uniref:hypothetical protein n=1 Tax=Schlesneria sphaerica TaxID=3373610 RepID=UPI0037CCB420